jgi:transcriptional regulator with XRE-family HTH domain
MNSVGERIKAARKAAGLTQEQAARAADITTSTFQKLEAGNQMPRLDTAGRIAAALGVPLVHLFPDTPTEVPA